MSIGPKPGFRWVAVFVAAVLAVVAGVMAVEAVRLAGDALERPGIDAFYEQPADAAIGDPGNLVKTDALLGAPFAARAWRIMYRTTAANGDPVVSTGVLVVPLAPRPPGGRTVVSWGAPDHRRGAECAPSYAFDPFALIEGLRSLLDRGYAVVATDYVGHGHRRPRLVPGRRHRAGTPCSTRCAPRRRVPEANASDRVHPVGHSQGGQAVLFAAQRAEEYAPELQIEAVAVAAPAADLTALMGSHLDDISGVTIGSYAFTAYSETYPGRRWTAS